MMDKFLMIEQADRYLNHEMSDAECHNFEKICADYPEAKALLEEHRVFLDNLNIFSERTNLQSNLNETYALLVEKGVISESAPVEAHNGKLVSIFHKYKKVTAIAASIAGFTAIVISGIMTYVSPSDKSTIQKLSRDIAEIKKTQAYQSSKILEVASKVPKGAVVKSGGSAFMIDGKGYFITNAHILNGSGVIVVNSKGQEFKSNIVYIDQNRDLAILKITDHDYKTIKSLPYGIERSKMELGQDIFTLGYPRNEVVYNTGYISAATGFDGDTSTIQLSMLANPGNSGGPVFNSNGDVVGVLSTRETKMEGVSFAVKSNEISQMLSDWERTDTSARKLKETVGVPIKNLSRVAQIKKLENYVYFVKVY